MEIKRTPIMAPPEIIKIGEPTKLHTWQIAHLQFTEEMPPLTCTIVGVRLYTAKDPAFVLVKYDVKLWLGEADGEEQQTRIPNVESKFLTSF